VSREAFAALLARLDADPDRAGERYEDVRLRLIRFFQWGGGAGARRTAVAAAVSGCVGRSAVERARVVVAFGAGGSDLDAGRGTRAGRRHLTLVPDPTRHDRDHNTTGREVIGAKVKGNVKAGQASSHIVD